MINSLREDEKETAREGLDSSMLTIKDIKRIKLYINYACVLETLCGTNIISTMSESHRNLS